MAKTLFVVKDSDFDDLPSEVSDPAIAEVKRLFAFVSGFVVSVLELAAFPERIDFTDSIVKVGPADDDVSVVQNQALNLERQNVVFSARGAGVTLTMPPNTHVPS